MKLLKTTCPPVAFRLMTYELIVKTLSAPEKMPALPPLEAELLGHELQALGIDDTLYRALALCCWLGHLRLRRESWLVRSPSWVQANLHAVVDHVREVA